MHIGRDEVFCLFPRNCDKRFITYRTAREWERDFLDRKGGKYLVQLFTYIVIIDEQVPGCQRPFSKSSIPRQDYTVLFERKADDLVVIERSVVEDIESQESHPLRESAQHNVGDEFHVCSPRKHKDAKKKQVVSQRRWALRKVKERVPCVL
jgi:hypothetical protein